MVNFYCLFWTNFWYLFYFFVCLLLACYYIRSSKIKIAHLFLSFLLTFYVYELTDFAATNKQLLLLNFSYSNFNFFLLNNLNKIHPFIFYVSVWLILALLFSLIKLFFCTNKFFLTPLLKRNSNFYCSYSLIFNVTALIFGSWWALQEGTWGGWWNWDPSEVLGLGVSFATSYSLHFSQISFFRSVKLHVITILIFFLLFAYYFIQLNFDLVSHNFGIKFFFFFDNNFFLIENLSFTAIFSCLIISYYMCHWTTVYLLKYTSKTKSLNALFRKVRYFYIIVLIILVNCYLFYSFSFLINYFCWKFFSVNLFNFYLTDASCLNVFFFTYFFLLVLVVKPFLFNLFWVVLFFSHYLQINVFFFNSFFVISAVIHFTLLCFLLTSLLSHKTPLLYWSFKPKMFFLYSAQLLLLFNDDTTILDSSFYDSLSFLFLPQNNWILSWNCFFLLEFFTNLNFILCVFPFKLMSFLMLNSFASFIFFVVELPYVNNLFAWISFFFNSLFIVFS